MDVPFFSFDFDKFEVIERQEEITWSDPSWHRSPIKAVKWARKIVDTEVREKYASLSRIETVVRNQYLDEDNRLRLPGMQGGAQ